MDGPKAFRTGSRIMIEYVIPPGGHEREMGFLQEISGTFVTYISVYNGLLIFVNLLSANVLMIRTLTEEENKVFNRRLEELEKEGIEKH